jgi:hypothetical protein
MAASDFVLFSNWRIEKAESTGEMTEIKYDPHAKPGDDKFCMTFGITNTYNEQNQLYAFIKLNRACPSSGASFVLHYKTSNGHSYKQNVAAEKESNTPILNPLSAQHKGSQDILNSNKKQAVDEFSFDTSIPVGLNLRLVGSQVISSNNFDTAAKFEADLQKTVQDTYTISNGYRPIMFTLGATANQAFTNKVVLGGIEARIYSRRPLAGYINRSELQELFVPPFPIEKVGNMPWVGISLIGSYVAERDKHIVTPGNSRFYSYLKPQVSMVIDQLRGSSTLLPSGLGLDLGAKAWIFLSGRENAGADVHNIEYHAHALLTLKFGSSQKGYFGYEIGTNEANGFSRNQGWALGLNLQF